MCKNVSMHFMYLWSRYVPAEQLPLIWTEGMLTDSSLQVLQTFLSLYTTNAFAAHEMQSDTAFRGNKLSGKGCAEPIRIEHSVNTLEVDLHLLQR